MKFGRLGGMDALWLALGRRLIFKKIKDKFGAHLRALICGSAPLAVETQQFFHDAGDSGAAGLRADGNDGDLHHGRSHDASGARVRGPGDFRN